MEVTYKSACGRYIVNFDEKDQQGLFAKIAAFQEIFEDDTSVVINDIEVPVSDIRLRVRTVDGNEFYEKVYAGSNPKLFGYKMEYGSQKENKGHLFPKRKDKDGTYYKNGGWHKWEGGGQATDTPAPAAKGKNPAF